MSDERAILFGQPCFDQREAEAAAAVVNSCWIGQGGLVEKFEREFGAYVEAANTVAVSSCTAAIELALRAAGVGPGDEVITTPMTFVATVNAIDETGATPVLADVDRETLLLTPETARQAVTPRTRAIVPVSFGGRPLDLEGFLGLADDQGLWIVEDAAHSVGAIAAGAPVGATRHERLLTCFSFYPNKNLASAEGGAITAASSAIAESLTSMRLHGLGIDAWKRYTDNAFHPSLAARYGTKCNWTDLQAAIALVQLQKLEGFLAVRQFLAGVYDRRLEGAPGIDRVPRIAHSLRSRHALHLYQVRLSPDRRDAVIRELRAEGIGATVHYFGVNLHPHFADRFPGPYPASDLASRELVTLPLHPGMAPGDVERICDRLRQLASG